MAHRLSCSSACGMSPEQGGIEPKSAALADGVSIIELSGKALIWVSGAGIFPAVTCSWSGLLQAILFPDSILEAKFER